ncbi:hypothetical protein L083_5974 [Actinoplanes sp. N902-109]|nr:hypothetical protein L083_5974 [Actinoplanes sp. N902-109]
MVGYRYKQDRREVKDMEIISTLAVVVTNVLLTAATLVAAKATRKDK